MGVQILTSSGDGTSRQEMFSPAHDLGRCWPALVVEATNHLARGHLHPAALAAMEAGGVDVTQVQLALLDLIRSTVFALDPNVKTPYDALVAAGFFQHPPAACMAVMNQVGVVCTGAWFDSMKRCTPLGDVPTETARLVAAGKQMADDMAAAGRSNLAAVAAMAGVPTPAPSTP